MHPPRSVILEVVRAFSLGVQHEHARLLARLDELAPLVADAAALAYLDGRADAAGSPDERDEARAAAARERGDVAEDLVVRLADELVPQKSSPLADALLEEAVR